MGHDESAAEPTGAPAPGAPAPSPTASAARGGADMVGWAVQRIRRRREKISAEIERNRRGEAAVPTWVLALLLVVILGGWLALVALV